MDYEREKVGRSNRCGCMKPSGGYVDDVASVVPSSDIGGVQGLSNAPTMDAIPGFMQ